MKIMKYFKDNHEKLPDIKDILIIIGLVLAGKGIYLIYEPAAWIVIGSFLIFLGWPRRKVR